jgi:hypothetical protein
MVTQTSFGNLVHSLYWRAFGPKPKTEKGGHEEDDHDEQISLVGIEKRPRQKNALNSVTVLCFKTTDWAIKSYYLPTLVTFFLMFLSPIPLSWDLGNSSRLAFLVIVNCILYHNLHDSDPGYVDPPPGYDPKGGRLNFYHGRGALLDAENGVANAGAPAEFEWRHWPPMRTVFCGMKKKYVSKFDHSCDILQTAIGERNHTLFWWWLLGSFCQFLQAAAIAKTRFSWSGDHTSIEIVPAFLVVLFMDFLIFLSGTLLVTHTGLLVTATTTFEFLEHERLPYLADTNFEDFAFSKGIFTNLKTACWIHGFLLLRESWTPHPWTRPLHIDRDSNDIYNNPFQNKYWSCF